MSTNSSIEWTDATWNPVSGCTRVSAGCDNCYAVKQTYRLGEMGQRQKYGGLTVLNPKGERHFNGVVRTSEAALTIPLKRQKPTKYFVNSMSDLFHKEVPFDFIDRVFAVMALCPQHVFQVLTKRPERMAEYLAREDAERGDTFARVAWQAGLVAEQRGMRDDFAAMPWPLPNCWLGTSVENQPAADERIPYLLRCPAAVRFLSFEPLLGPIDLDRTGTDWMNIAEGIDWVIVGGESGPGARPMDVAWARSLVRQCQAADVAIFVKQLGNWVSGPHDFEGWKSSIDRWLLRGKDGKLAAWRRPVLRSELSPEYYDQRPENAVAWGLANAKGGNPDEWPTDLRVREFPGAAVPA